jgi:hypothetical protein
LSTFVKGLAWTVALLSGIATIFALFGGQQWLEQQGWTLAPSTATTTENVETAESEGAPQTTGDTAQEPSDRGLDLSRDGILAWSERTFDNVLWGIAAIGASMLLAGGAGALFLHMTAAIDAVEGFFLGLFGTICLAAVVVVGILLHAADPAYLVWLIILTVLSAPAGFLAPILADGY